MMKRNIIGLSKNELNNKDDNFTATEISQQPALWQKTFLLAVNQKEKISSFIRKFFKQNNYKVDIILSGAGTSAFVGNSLTGLLQKNFGIRTRAIATTDIVTHPEYYFQKDNPTLLISFARSGDSPESLATVQLANQLCSNINHIIITCNAAGKLASNSNKDNSLVIILPPESNDRGLAMTGSFTAMLLMGILISKISQLESLKNDISLLSQYGQRIIDNYAKKLKEICELQFERAVFLGSGELMGCAEECHLKLQELTDGKVITKFDSFLGFRHGPKAIINPKTLIIYLFSTNPYIARYEFDLLKAVNNGERGIFSIGVSEINWPEINVDSKILLSSKNNTTIDPDFLPVCYVLVGQILGYYKSLQLGLKPDAPSESDTITRVVQGVKIYSYDTK